MQLHFIRLEVLAIIEGIQKRLDRTFTPEEIESGILEDLIIEDDYNIERVVSCIRTRYVFYLDLLRI